MAKIIERRVVTQDWYETDTNKNGWDSQGWMFDDGRYMGTTWTIIEHIHVDKLGNPFLAVAEREVDV